MSDTNYKKNNRQPIDAIKSSVVANEKIKHAQVRVISKDGEQLGLMSARDALYQARSQGLDLVEVTSNASPPVVRITDLNKWIYNLRREKKEQSRRARESVISVKEIQLRPVTDKHDIAIKVNHAKNFLEDDAKVKIVIKFRGREMAFAQKGYEVMQTFLDSIPSCKIEKNPEMNGKTLMAIIAPATKKS